MEAIKHKVVPIFYSKSGILYFDAIEDFDGKKFIYLKKVRKNNPMYRYASHKINLRKAKLEFGDKLNFTPLEQLVKNIWIAVEEEKIQYGIPVGVSDHNVVELSERQKREFLWFPKKLDIAASIYKVATSSTYKGLIPVGHGLCFIDGANSFMYDAGGSLGYGKFVAKIPKIRYKVVISHMHFDHYKYLASLNNDGLVQSVLLPEKVYAGERVEAVLDSIPNAESIRRAAHPVVVASYNIYTPNPSLVLESDLNTSSLIASGNGWVLTGDSKWPIVIDKLGKLIMETNIQVPHHGSKSSGHPKKDYFNGRKSFWVSYRHNVHKLPRKDIDDDYKKLGSLTKVKA